MISPFHLAFPVTDLEKTRHFYRDVLGCRTGRESEHWIDFDFWGHQLVAHLVSEDDHPSAATNAVDGDQVPSSHFGVVLPWDSFQALSNHLKAQGLTFTIEPKVRFQGQKGEQATMFFADPSGNYLEFKAFKDPEMLFAVD